LNGLDIQQSTPKFDNLLVVPRRNSFKLAFGFAPQKSEYRYHTATNPDQTPYLRTGRTRISDFTGDGTLPGVHKGGDAGPRSNARTGKDSAVAP
jgi:hypothetical protein